MKTELIKFILGDYCGDGHGILQTFILEIIHDNSLHIIERLNRNEDILCNKFGISVSSWFRGYQDNKIPETDVKLLKNFNIEFNNDMLNKDNSLTILDGEEYIQIWIQLMQLVDKNLFISIKKFKSFESACSGYGLYDL